MAIMACANWFVQTEFITQTQKRFQIKQHIQAPAHSCILGRVENFHNTGGLKKGKAMVNLQFIGRTENDIYVLQQTSKKVSEGRGGERDLRISRSIIHVVLRRRIQIYQCKLRIIQKSKLVVMLPTSVCCVVY